MTDPVPSAATPQATALSSEADAIRWLGEVNGVAQAQTDAGGRRRWSVTHPALWLGITGPDLVYCCKVLQAMSAALPQGK